MKKRAVLFITLLAISVFFIANQSFAIGLEIAGGVWGQGPSGDISYKSDAITDQLDIEEDLKYEKEYKAMGRAKLDMPGMLPNI